MAYKKIIVTVLTGIFLTAGVTLASDATVRQQQTQRVVQTFADYGYTASPKDITYWRLPGKRTQIGTLEENLQLRWRKDHPGQVNVLKDPFSQEELAEAIFNPEEIGVAFRPSNFKTTLAQTLSEGVSATGNYRIALSSLTTKAPESYTLKNSDFASANIFIKINPGTTNEEIVKCVGISSTSTALIDCTRGYNSYNGSTNVNRVRPHGPGETVIITNDDHYLVLEFPAINDDSTILGSWKFATTTSSTILTLGGGTANYDVRIYANIKAGKDNWGFLEYNATSSKWFSCNTPTNCTDLATGGSGTGLTAENPITITSGEVNLATNTDVFILNASNQLSIRASSTGAALDIDSRGLFVDTGSTTAEFNWLMGPTGNQYGDGVQNTTTIRQINLLSGVSSANATTGGVALLLPDSSNNRQDANPLHYHRMVSGTANQSGTGNKTITHNLGVVPSLVVINYYKAGASTVAAGSGTGIATSTSDGQTSSYVWSDTSQGYSGIGTSTIMFLENFSGTDILKATLSTLTATTFVINITTNTLGTTGANVHYTWTVYP